MSFWSKLFRKKNDEKIDYSKITLLIRDVKKETHIKYISENILSKDKYFHEFQVTSNPKIKVFIDCKFMGTKPIALEDTLKNDYSKIITKPTIKVGDGKTEVSKLENSPKVDPDLYMINLDNFLKLCDKWNIEINRDQNDPTMKYVLHAENKTRSINMYLVFYASDIYEDIIDYMEKTMRTSYNKYKEKVSK